MTSFTARLAARQALTERVAAMTLTSDVPLPSYAPGSHIRVNLPDGDTRAYSLIDFEEPDPSHYQIAVQLEPDGQGGSRFMHGLQVGGEIEISAPKCDFALIEAPALFLAGGIGITPLISMAAALACMGQPFAFHYAGRSAPLMAYRDEVAHRFGARIHCDDMPDALDLPALMASVVAGQHVYVCGPRGMIDAARAEGEAAGIAPDHIHFELFETAAPQEGDASFEVELASTGQVFTVKPEQSIIDALEEGGVDVMYDCQRGDCGICQCDVISGTPDHRDVVLSEAERASGKVMQICVSRARSARLVLDI